MLNRACLNGHNFKFRWSNNVNFTYLIIEAHVHPTVEHHVLTSEGHQYTATTNIYMYGQSNGSFCVHVFPYPVQLLPAINAPAWRGGRDTYSNTSGGWIDRSPKGTTFISAIVCLHAQFQQPRGFYYSHIIYFRIFR